MCICIIRLKNFFLGHKQKGPTVGLLPKKILVQQKKHTLKFLISFLRKTTYVKPKRAKIVRSENHSWIAPWSSFSFWMFYIMLEKIYKIMDTPWGKLRCSGKLSNT